MTQSFQLLVSLGLAITQVFSTFGTHGTREDSVVSASRTVEIHEYSVVSATGTLGLAISYWYPWDSPLDSIVSAFSTLGLAMTQSCQLLVPLGLV